MTQPLSTLNNSFVKTSTLSKKGLIVLSVFKENEKIYGQQIISRTNIKSGTLYPLLISLEEAGWLKRENEQGDERKLGRPLRVYHHLTSDGEKKIFEKKRELENKMRELEQQRLKIKKQLTSLEWVQSF
jgi:DNA-binding MarR family transcriptional regulator